MTDTLTWSAHARVVRLVGHYLQRESGPVVPAGLAAAVADGIGYPYTVDTVDESRITAAISAVVWVRASHASHGWLRREDVTPEDLVEAIESALPCPAAPLIMTQKPGLTGDSHGDLDRIAQWSVQHESLARLGGKTIGLDFDGTIHTYDRWTGVEPEGEPTPYAVEFVQALVRAGVKVVLSTCRAAEPGGQQAVEDWLSRHGFPPFITVTSEKPQAVAYIDDRAVPYRGTWIDCLQAAAALVGTHPPAAAESPS